MENSSSLPDDEISLAAIHQLGYSAAARPSNARTPIATPGVGAPGLGARCYRALTRVRVEVQVVTGNNVTTSALEHSTQEQPGTQVVTLLLLPACYRV